MKRTFDELQPYLDKGMALSTALTLMEWDMETLAPEESDELTSKVVGILSEEFFTTYINDDVKKIFIALEEEGESSQLSTTDKAIIKQLKKLYAQLEPIPQKEYKQYSELTAVATNIWSRAKESNDFYEFAPTLNKIIFFSKKFAGYRANGNDSMYNILLEDFEPDFRMEQLEELFGKIKAEIIPLIQTVAEKNSNKVKKYDNKIYDIEKQREFCNWLAEYVGFDSKKGVIAESAHPFTTNMHNKDVRITNHYYEDKLDSAIFSIIHEAGHAIYEMNVDDEITQTLVGTGASMGMHESQSRFFENIIGRSKAFWQPIYPKLVDTFYEQLKDVSLDEFVEGINLATPGLIRTEADELTYPLHVLIRYEMEKMIFSNEIQIEHLSQTWNQKYEEYLGVRPDTCTEGILQDVHWSQGSFGYFPSYVIGSAVAAQIYYHIKAVMPFEEYLMNGNLEPIREYLRDAIHTHGMLKSTNELLLNLMNEEFNSDYYIRYLKEKFGDA